MSKQEKSLCDFFGDNLSPEIEAELHTIGDEVAEYLSYVSNFLPTTEQQNNRTRLKCTNTTNKKTLNSVIF